MCNVFKLYDKEKRRAEEDVLPSSDYVIDGTKELEEKVEEIIKFRSVNMKNSKVKRRACRLR